MKKILKKKSDEIIQYVKRKKTERIENVRTGGKCTTQDLSLERKRPFKEMKQNDEGPFLQLIPRQITELLEELQH